MFWRITCALIFGCFLPTVASGQVISPYVNHITMADGLLDGINYYITRDSRGFVWISSQNGLNRYDGNQIRQYETGISPSDIKGQFVQSKMFEDEQGNLYFTTYDGGINCYQRATDSFENWLLFPDSNKHLTGYHAFHLDKNNKLWVLVNNTEVYHFDLKTHRTKHLYSTPFETHFCHLVEDSQGNPLLSVSTNHNGQLTIARFADNDISISHKTLKYSGKELHIKRVRPDGDSLLWFTDQNALYSYRFSNMQLKRHLALNSGNLPRYGAMEFFNKDTLVLALGDQGLYFFDCRKEQIVAKVLPAGKAARHLNPGHICAVNVLSDGSVWCNICEQGVDYFYPAKTKFNVVSIPESLKSANQTIVTTSLLETNGEIWCSTAFHGILVFDPQGNFKRWYHTNAPPHRRLPSNMVRQLFLDRGGRIWILTDKELLVLDQKISPVLAGEMLAICQLDNGNFVVAPRKGGLIVLEAKSPNTFTGKQLQHIETTSHYVNLWTDNSGRLFGNKDLLTVDVHSTYNGIHLQKQLPLSGEVVFMQEAHQQRIWIGSGNGLFIFNTRLDTATVQHLSRQNGLPSNVVFALEQVDHAIWIGTDKGLSKYDLGKKTFTNYSTFDGLPSDKIGIECLLYSSNGILWIGTSDGIALVNPANIRQYTNPAQTAIINIWINDLPPKDLFCNKTGAKNVTEFKSLKLEPGNNTVSFTIAALEYSNPGTNKFSYYIEGIDDNWIDAGTNNFIRYAKIPPGHYTFWYRASNSEQLWGQEQSLELFIMPPFYKTWPFYTLFGLAAAFLLWVIVWFRHKKRMEREMLAAAQRAALEAERQRIARDMHDDLGSSLSALSLMTQIALSKQNGELRSDMERINKSALEIGGKIREVIWMVSANNDSLASLVSYLYSYTTKLSKDTGIECDITIPDNLPDIKLGSELRRNLYLCFKEALNNALKYAHASLLTTVLSFENNTLQIKVADNGRGFDPALTLSSSGNGLRNMQERMRQIGGTCEIATGPNGTTITFALRLHT